MVAFFEHGFFGDFAVVGIAEPRHQLVVLGLGLVLLLFEPLQHDVRIGDALKPGEAALDFRPVRYPPGGRRDALGPSRRVLVFLLGEAKQDVAALRILLAVGEMFVRGRRLDFAAPHHLDGDEVRLVDRHYPISLSNSTIVPMPAAMSSTWRAALRSTAPRCRSGIRSDIAM